MTSSDAFSTTETTSTAASQPSIPKETSTGGGVADYFAVLGIGETLVLKSTQKKKQRISTSTDDEKTHEDQAALIAEDEKYAMFERFYREIVEVAIFTVFLDGDGNGIGGALATSENSLEDHSDTDDCTKSIASENSNEASAPNGHYFPLLQQPQLGEGSLPKELSGYNILYNTTPAGKGSTADSSYTFPPGPSENSFAHDQDTSLSFSVNTTNDAIGDHLISWSKAQTYNANLHLSKGLRNNVLSSIPVQEHSTADNDIIHNETNKKSAHTNQREQESRAGLLGKFVGRRVVGKLRNQISPKKNLSPTTKFDSFDCDGDGISNFITPRNSTFYVGYRRRGADDIEKPAVADLVVRYCRIHRSTIRPFHERYKSSPTATIRKTVPDDHHNEERDHDGNIEGVEKSPVHDTNVQGEQMDDEEKSRKKTLRKRIVSKVVSNATRMAASGTSRILRNKRPSSPSSTQEQQRLENDEAHRKTPERIRKTVDVVCLSDLLTLPNGFDEWVIPNMYQTLQLPTPKPQDTGGDTGENSKKRSLSFLELEDHYGESKEQILPQNSSEARMQKTFLFNHKSSPFNDEKGVGIEAFVDGNTFLSTTPYHVASHKYNTPDAKRNPWSPTSGPPTISVPSSPSNSSEKVSSSHTNEGIGANNPNDIMPIIIPTDNLPNIIDSNGETDYEYIPILAVRRQRVGDEERYHEDPAIAEIEMTFLDLQGKAVMPVDDDLDEEETEEEDIFLKKSSWAESDYSHHFSIEHEERGEDEEIFPPLLGLPSILLSKNLPLGFADTPFATGVLDRFPKKDYKGVPLPEEELPMFCYPTGCRLSRQQYQDAPLAECYGFVVKNERGDSIHVSCVSFMEPLTKAKERQLNRMSIDRMKTSLPHKIYCEKIGLTDCQQNLKQKNLMDDILIGFDQMTTFENKTICLVSRYPFWSAFRRFLSHLHIISGSSSTIPIERFVSHLLLTVPVPKPGDSCILVPLPAIASPMVIWLPPAKDLPLLDLPLQRLFSCLDIPTVVTIVLGFLALERKVIIMSSYPSLVTDVCELLRSLLFPFELCAPYVPRLTQPFMSCLEFPGAIFAGIHDDGCADGLAAKVRQFIPEDTAIVDLDSGDIDCSGDRYKVLTECWDVIPSEHRSLLISEIESLCENAGLVPGQEPVGVEIEAAFSSSVIPSLEDDVEELDDRAVRDCFLRFFCSLLGGYERFLLVPDIDFLISGNEWFDTEGFLATASGNTSRFLSAFVTTQNFQSFIQRRTEASDVHCLFFDECLAEFHSSKIPYGDFKRDVTQNHKVKTGNMPFYNLLVDQCAANVFDGPESDEISDKSILTTNTENGFMVNNCGDLVTAPSSKHLPSGSRYVYCADGAPYFPQQLDPDMFFPSEPDCLSTDFIEMHVPVLTRSDREMDVSKLRRRLAVSHRGVQRQRRCLFQFPKLLGSHVLNTILMCVPSQVSQPDISLQQQTQYLLRALGILRHLRSRQRIVPDEAGYRCLIVSCGRSNDDRRVEVVKLFGLLRSDGIFPSAVTLGQYTRAIAEGFSKRSSGISDSSVIDSGGIEATTITDISDELLIESLGKMDPHVVLNLLDENIQELEESGRRWRHRRDKRKISSKETKANDVEEVSDVQNEIQDGKSDTHSPSKPSIQKRKAQKPWCPILRSSSISPHWKASTAQEDFTNLVGDFKFMALWSRTGICKRCSYIILDEEIQAGWDAVGENDETSCKIACPSCSFMLEPMIGYQEYFIDNATSKLSTLCPEKAHSENSESTKGIMNAFHDLPQQISRHVPNSTDTSKTSGFVPYLNPSRLRLALEKYIEEHGEDILEREKLRSTDPTIFFNLWWYCARFSVPLPLSISTSSGSSSRVNWMAFAAWDKSVALEGCRSGLSTVLKLQTSLRKLRKRPRSAQLQSIIQTFNKPDSSSGVYHTKQPRVATTENEKTGHDSGELTDDSPISSYMTLQATIQRDWDNIDLSSILVTLVDACDKRDFYPVVSRLLQCNTERRARYAGQSGVELECYHTLLYLSRYHCMSAFHKFFPSSSKTCKGYHFWCPKSTMSIFDRMFRDAIEQLRAEGNTSPVHTVSDVALGFRSVFGHII